MVAAAYDVKNWGALVAVSCAAESENEPWRDLDRRLRSIAARRSALDHEELTLIREAVRVQLWRRFGMASMREYLELAMGYGPQVAAERLRVADALEGLPALEEALGTNELSYSAVRELTRIATCKTEEAWLDACHGKSLREIEELVAERESGDAPSDRPKPDLRVKAVRLMLRPSARALLRQVRHAVANERGERIDDSDLIEELCRMYLAGSETSTSKCDEESSRRASRPPVQIAITRCPDCKQARQHAAGKMIPITEAEYETAACDAVMIGSLDGAPERARSTIPPATRRLVKLRDQGKCAVPWCRAAANVDLHHLEHRAHGGGHEPENLGSLCYGHHSAYHRGDLLIEGKAPDLTFRRKAEVPHVGDLHAPRVSERAHPQRLCEPDAPQQHREPEDPQLLRDARLALTTLGFTKRQADEAVAVARDEVKRGEGLEPLLRAALRAIR